jgi:hypothetical protein
MLASATIPALCNRQLLRALSIILSLRANQCLVDGDIRIGFPSAFVGLTRTLEPFSGVAKEHSLRGDGFPSDILMNGYDHADLRRFTRANSNARCFLAEIGLGSPA